jgi:hypothetical protein
VAKLKAESIVSIHKRINTPPDNTVVFCHKGCMPVAPRNTGVVVVRVISLLAGF